MRAYPYVRDQHNQVDALGHAALMLTYTITLILRNDSDDAFVGEIFPRAGCAYCHVDTAQRGEEQPCISLARYAAAVCVQTAGLLSSFTSLCSRCQRS